MSELASLRHRVEVGGFYSDQAEFDFQSKPNKFFFNLEVCFSHLGYYINHLCLRMLYYLQSSGALKAENILMSGLNVLKQKLSDLQIQLQHETAQEALVIS